MTPKELLCAHRYSEAAVAYQTHLLQHPEQNYHGGLGDALLGLGHFPEAVTSFKKAHEMELKRTKGHFAYLNEVGTAMWLAGNKSSAIWMEPPFMATWQEVQPKVFIMVWSLRNE